MCGQQKKEPIPKKAISKELGRGGDQATADQKSPSISVMEGELALWFKSRLLLPGMATGRPPGRVGDQEASLGPGTPKTAL